MKWRSPGFDLSLFNHSVSVRFICVKAKSDKRRNNLEQTVKEAVTQIAKPTKACSDRHLTLGSGLDIKSLRDFMRARRPKPCGFQYPPRTFVRKNNSPNCFFAHEPFGSSPVILSKKQDTPFGVSCFLVRETGLEPVRDYHTPLKRARLPIPPLSLGRGIIAKRSGQVKSFFCVF